MSLCWAGRGNNLQSTRPDLCTLACCTCPCLNSGLCGTQEMSSQQEAVSAEGGAQPMDTEDVSSKPPAPSFTTGAPSRYPTLSACCLSAQYNAWLHHLASIIRHAAACSYEGTGKRHLHCRSFLVHCAGRRMHCMPGASSFASAACYQDKMLFNLILCCHFLQPGEGSRLAPLPVGVHHACGAPAGEPGRKH